MIAIIDYGAGNITSVQNAMTRLGVSAIRTADATLIQSADKVIFPGVGEAAAAMLKLREAGLVEVIRSLRQPVLGICLGQQLLCRHSEESDTNGLGIFDLAVKRFPPKDKIPHIGWNNLSKASGPLFQNVGADPDLYFLHSYYVELGEATTATCHYIVEFSAALQKDNFYATQFHPEKSADVGSQILKNFLAL
jgi:imidazole glycerol-phosphate synthase subunit HisH